MENKSNLLLRYCARHFIYIISINLQNKPPQHTPHTQKLRWGWGTAKEGLWLEVGRDGYLAKVTLLIKWQTGIHTQVHLTQNCEFLTTRMSPGENGPRFFTPISSCLAIWLFLIFLYHKQCYDGHPYISTFVITSPLARKFLTALGKLRFSNRLWWKTNLFNFQSIMDQYFCKIQWKLIPRNRK